MDFWVIKYAKILMIQFWQNRDVSGILLILFILNGCINKPKELGLPFINKPDFTPEWINTNEAAYKSIHQIPAFSFINQDGQTVTEKSVEGKIYVVDFIFTRCASICPKMTRNLKMVQDSFDMNEDVLLLSHSVTPEMDSVPILKKYAVANGIKSEKWHLLTGSQDSIYRLAKKEYFAGDTIGYYQTGNEFLHTENVILVDRKRRIRGVYDGTLEIEIQVLIEDIKTLIKE